MDFKGKKVLLMGLGVLGGGVATAKWLVEHGVDLTVTDIKTEEHLKKSVEKLANLNIKYVLGRHEEQDFLDTDILVINPDVPIDNKFVQIAIKAGKQIENELTLFFKYAKYKTIIGVTGTRGKTTTTNWIGYILKKAGIETRILGNDPEKPFLSEINRCTEETVVVMEAPSFQLETADISLFAPHIAVVTNLYQDHLSRHKVMESYALAKANIFKNQSEKDFLILNKDNEWTPFFLSLKPKSKVIFSSDINLPNFNSDKFSLEHGMHNLQNFLIAASACKAFGLTEEQILVSVDTLPEVKWREELVFKSDNLKIYNDTAATSPEATISAINRFTDTGANIILITGGTDRELDFKQLGLVLKNKIPEQNLILLSGSATEKIKKELGDYKIEEYDTLKECFESAASKAENSKLNTIILFSPASKSFEKFKNEFDRGEKFNELIETLR